MSQRFIDEGSQKGSARKREREKPLVPPKLWQRKKISKNKRKEGGGGESFPSLSEGGKKRFTLLLRGKGKSGRGPFVLWGGGRRSQLRGGGGGGNDPYSYPEKVVDLMGKEKERRNYPYSLSTEGGKVLLSEEKIGEEDPEIVLPKRKGEGLLLLKGKIPEDAARKALPFRKGISGILAF